MQQQEVNNTYTKDYVRSEVERLLGLRCTYRTINKILHVNYNYVRKVKKELGITRYKPNPIYNIIGNNTMTAYDVYDDYNTNQLSTNEIATKAGCTQKTVSAILQYFGVDVQKNRKGRKYRSIIEYIHKRYKIKKPEVHRNSKLKQWRITHGKLLIPVYEEIQKGATILDACKKHNVLPSYARHQFQVVQKKYAAYLDFGQPIIFKLIISKTRLKQFEWVAKQTHNNVLDWALDNLKAICDSKDYYNGRKTNSNNGSANGNKDPKCQTNI